MYHFAWKQAAGRYCSMLLAHFPLNFGGLSRSFIITMNELTLNAVFLVSQKENHELQHRVLNNHLKQCLYICYTKSGGNCAIQNR